EGDFCQGRDWKARDALEAFTCIVKDELRRAVVLARDLPAEADGLDDRVAREGVVVERAAELGLLRRESTHDAVHVNRTGPVLRGWLRFLSAHARGATRRQ